MMHKELFEVLQDKNLKLVLAESCTAGLACATLGKFPGVSNHLCGSFVVYRPLQKQNILNVPASLIEEFTTESKEVVDWLAKEALTLTPEANWSGAIVGHLGPSSADGKDGLIWISIYGRSSKYVHRQIKLSETGREERMVEAVDLFLLLLKDSIEG